MVVKNLYRSDGVTSSDEEGERCRRKESFSKLVKVGLQFPVGRISCSLKKGSYAIRCVDMVLLTSPPFLSSLPPRFILDILLSPTII